MKQTSTLFTDGIWGNSQAELISKTLGKQPRCLLTEHEANSHSVYWQNLKQQPRCVMIEHEQTATLFTDRTWGKQPRCFMTEHADRTCWQNKMTNSHTVYWKNISQTATLFTDRNMKQAAALFTDRTWCKRPRCLMTGAKHIKRMLSFKQVAILLS